MLLPLGHDGGVLLPLFGGPWCIVHITQDVAGVLVGIEVDVAQVFLHHELIQKCQPVD